MISVREALDHILALSDALPSEDIALQYAQGRVLAQTVTANRDQPPFAAAAMDGYAIRATDLAAGAQTWQVIGESAAGHPFLSPVAAGQATRIFTGAPLPQGTDHVLIQENVCAKDGQITLIDGPNDAAHRRPAGSDFTKGHQLRAPRRLSAQDIALLAAMNVPRPNVTRRPKVALIATGDELVQPGDAPRDDQIIASNSYGLAAMLQKAGAEARILPIARDRLGSLAEVFALTRDADLVLTIGGASVGDYDLVAQIKKEISIPLIFSGDVRTIDDARMVYDRTGVDGFMIGRGMQGQPWKLKQLQTEALGQEFKISQQEIIRCALKHLDLLTKHYGDHGLFNFRKHIPFYIHDFEEAAGIRKELMVVESYGQLTESLNQLI